VDLAAELAPADLAGLVLEGRGALAGILPAVPLGC
jgi:hypothetical protein